MSAMPDALQVSESNRPLVSGLRPGPRDTLLESSEDLWSDLDVEAEPDESPAQAPPKPVSRRQPRQPLGRLRAEPEEISSPVALGTLLEGRYRLLEVLSEGGMGTLVLARNEALDVDVVVKLLRADTPKEWGVSMAHRLVQEARAAARLGHPAIVRVLDFGVTDSGGPYLVMERLEGDDLSTELRRRGRIRPVKAVRCLLPIAHGLVAAHAKGIVHRDIKPENVFLARSDVGRVQPKLIDFGVAKLELDPELHRITDVGGLVGSPGYMAPEQAAGEEAGPAADIWSLCVVLYEMTTGHPPFEAKNCNALMRRIIECDPVPLAGYLPTETELSAIVERGMAKEPADRWQSMRALGEVLARWLLGRGVTEDVCGQSLDTTWLQGPPDSRAFDAFASVPPPSAHHLRQNIVAWHPPLSVPAPSGAQAVAAPIAEPRPAIRPPPAAASAASSLAAAAPLPLIPLPAPVMRELVDPAERGHSEAPGGTASPSAPTVRPGKLHAATAELETEPTAPTAMPPVAGPSAQVPALPMDFAASAPVQPAARAGVLPYVAIGAVAVAIAAALAAWLLARGWSEPAQPPPAPAPSAVVATE